jgi:hypothetical protein
MQTTITKLGKLYLNTVVVALVIALSGLPAAGHDNDPKRTPPEKDQPAKVEDLRLKLKAGTFKLTEAEVVKLVGRPTGVSRPGDGGAEMRMHWEYATFIFATFKDGKLSEVTGAFSENLPVERVTLANFKRLRVGMTEAEVVETLGKGNGVIKVGGVAVRSWGRNASLSVLFNAKGLAFGEGLHEIDAISAPPGFQLPLPGNLKP